MKTSILGIDISKAKFDVALLVNEKFKFKHFKNDISGFKALDAWLKKREVFDFHACMEATGNYGENLATHLHDNGFGVSVVNPAKIKGFAQCKLSRTKTDKTDAQLIAQFCQALKPNLWQPKPQHVRQMQQWVRRVDSLQSMRQQEYNREETTSLQEITQVIDGHIGYLDKQIVFAKSMIQQIITKHPDLQEKQKLLESIPGIGEATTGRILAFFGEPKDFDSGRAVAAFLGLNPRQHQSGSSVRGRTRISKTGDSRVRKSLYMPALVAMKHNPTIKAFCEKLRLKGKQKMVIVIAAMRKLVHIIYGVLKNGMPFDPEWEAIKVATAA